MTIYAVCTNCAHIEPRPSHAEDDWFDCEACDAHNPELHRDGSDAEERSQEIIEEIGMAVKEQLC
jgi:hypothetical protein